MPGMGAHAAHQLPIVLCGLCSHPLDVTAGHSQCVPRTLPRAWRLLVRTQAWADSLRCAWLPGRQQHIEDHPEQEAGYAAYGLPPTVTEASHGDTTLVQPADLKREIGKPQGYHLREMQRWEGSEFSGFFCRTRKRQPRGGFRSLRKNKALLSSTVLNQDRAVGGSGLLILPQHSGTALILPQPRGTALMFPQQSGVALCFLGQCQRGSPDVCRSEGGPRRRGKRPCFVPAVLWEEAQDSAVGSTDQRQRGIPLFLPALSHLSPLSDSSPRRTCVNFRRSTGPVGWPPAAGSRASPEAAMVLPGGPLMPAPRVQQLDLWRFLPAGCDPTVSTA